MWNIERVSITRLPVARQATITVQAEDEADTKGGRGERPDDAKNRTIA